MNRFGRYLLALLLFATLATVARAQVQENEVDPALRDLVRSAIGDTNSFVDRFDAEVWLLDMSTRLQNIVEDPEERLELLKLVHQEATRAGLEPEVVMALIQVESYFDRFAVSRVGARGLMQVMPFWLEELNETDKNLFHMDVNLRIGCTILRYYLDMEDGHMWKALARYHGSYPSYRYSQKVMRALSRRWFKQ